LGSIDNIDFQYFQKYFNSLSNNQKNNFRKFFQLIIAPHEINDYIISKIVKFLKFNNIGYDKYSKKKLSNNKEAIIIDTIGDLKDLYFFADITYIGGGLKGGVHSVFEAAIYNSIISYGPNYHLLHDAVNMKKNEISYVIKNHNDFYFINDLLDSEITIQSKKNEMKKFISNYSTISSKEVISFLRL